MGNHDSSEKHATSFMLLGDRSLTTAMDWSTSDLPTLAQTYSDIAKDTSSIFFGELPKIEGEILRKMGKKEISQISIISEMLEIDSLPDSVYSFGMEVLAGYGCASFIWALRIAGHFPDRLQEEGEKRFQDALENCSKKGWVSTLADMLLNAAGESYYDDLCSEVCPPTS